VWELAISTIILSERFLAGIELYSTCRFCSWTNPGMVSRNLIPYFHDWLQAQASYYILVNISVVYSTIRVYSTI
jgi:hypothetical protein